MKRSFTHELKPGQKVIVKGWVSRSRKLGGMIFFILRDREGSVQITAKKGAVPGKILETISSLGKEDCVEVFGKVVKSPAGGLEIVPEKVNVMSKAATPLPHDFSGNVNTGIDTRFDYRFLDLRNPKILASFRIRDTMLELTRQFYAKQGFVEVHTPVIQAAGAEGGATLFPLKFYKGNAFLRQSPQLYKQIMMATGLDNVYEIGPVFRAEKFHTRRHVSEFLSVDMEMAWIESEEDVMKSLEEMMVFIVKGLKKQRKGELDILEVKLQVPKLPFKRITYKSAVETLNKAGVKVKFGNDFGDPEEKKLGEILAKKGIEWYFLTKFPSSLKPFYIMLDGKLSRGFDLEFRGMELASGGQREHRYDVLAKVMKQKNLKPNDFKFYLDAFKYGMPAHGGYGLGADRLLQQLIGLEHVREAIIFPRTPDRLVP